MRFKLKFKGSTDYQEFNDFDEVDAYIETLEPGEQNDFLCASIDYDYRPRHEYDMD